MRGSFCTACVRKEPRIGWAGASSPTLPPCSIPVDCGIGFVAHSPLGRGFLTGRFRSIDDLPEGDFRRVNPRFEGENFGRNLELVARVEEIAAEKGVEAGQLALAWVLAQGEDVVPIPGTKRLAYLEQSAAAAVELSPEDLRRLDAVAPLGAVVGDRYADMSPLNLQRRPAPAGAAPRGSPPPAASRPRCAPGSR